MKDEVSQYDLNGQRGTIQKWSITTKRLETVATGIRVPYTLAFNRQGDLFVTDQEGETWCPGGNPLDELNHIIPGRNYGFPPRHENTSQSDQRTTGGCLRPATPIDLRSGLQRSERRAQVIRTRHGGKAMGSLPVSRAAKSGECGW